LRGKDKKSWKTWKWVMKSDKALQDIVAKISTGQNPFFIYDLLLKKALKFKILNT
jgi:hypothetical protein